MAEALPVVKGTLDVLVLKALSWGPMHGFEVTTWLEDRSGGVIARVRGHDVQELVLGLVHDL